MRRVLILFAVCTLPLSIEAQTRVEVIRGRVTTDSGEAIVAATIVLTVAPERTVLQAVTDSAGFYRVTVSSGAGDYLIHISYPGRSAFRKRILRDTSGSDTFVVDARLALSVQRLASVQVQSSRLRPTRGTDFATGVGNSERIVDAVAGALGPESLGDLNAAALTTPGVLAIDGGISAFGLPATQNTVTVGGMAFPSTVLPRDARVTTRVSTSTYDPARGWFSGVSTNADLIMGSLFRSSRGHLTIDAPALQGGTSPSLQGGQRYTGFQLALGGDGPFSYETQNFFNYSLQMSRRAADNRSMMSADDQLLTRLGLSPDSVHRAASFLGTSGPFPSFAGGAQQVSDAVTLIGRIDHAPVDRLTLAPARTTYGMMIYGRWAEAKGVGISPLTAPEYGNTDRSLSASVQAIFSRFLTNDYLNETRSAFSIDRHAVTPYTSMPSGRVTMGADANANAGLRDLRFGGSSSLAANVSQWTWETINETKFYAQGHPTHRVKLTLDSRIDGTRQVPRGDYGGTFTFASLEDLELNRPSSFTRSLGGETSTASEWNAFVAASDLWRVTPEFQIMYGARLEANRFLQRGTIPNAVGFDGLDPQVAPSGLDASPRLGFTWYLRTPSLTTRNNSIGSITIGPKAYIRGGIGAFRAMVPASLLSSSNIPGSPAGATEIRCLGDATPTPTWSAYAAGTLAAPAQCLESSLNTLVDSAASWRFVDRTYTAPKSWRANLGFGSAFKRLTYAIEGTYSLNLHQPDLTNANFSGVPVFSAAGENRPIFVAPEAIVPSTGAVAGRGARKRQDVGTILVAGTNGRSTARQLVATLTPDFANNIFLSASYTLSSVRARTSGYSGSTFGAPNARDWSRGAFDSRHQMILTFGVTGKGLTFSGQAQATSGIPFTPMVNADVNGDGVNNDRAFVFDPTSITDPSMRSGLIDLLDHGTKSARACLSKQIGVAAGRNSCEGPWRRSLNAQIAFANNTLRRHRVSSINLSMTNVLAGLDEALHGADGLHLWGASGVPDPVLYYVDGFDPGTKAFHYRVNRRFGAPSALALAALNPFRLAIDVAFTFGKSTAEQQLEQWLQPGRNGRSGPRLSADDLKRRFERNVPDPYGLVLQESDSLLLTRLQADTLAALRHRYRLAMDSIWTRVAEHMAALDDRYDVATALRYQEAAFDTAWEISRRDVQEHFPTVLSRLQLSMLPGWAGVMYRSKGSLSGIRTYMFGRP